MDRLKSFLSFWPLIVIVATLMSLGWSAEALQSSKVDVKEFEPVRLDVRDMKISRKYESEEVSLIHKNLDYLLLNQALDAQRRYVSEQGKK